MSILGKWESVVPASEYVVTPAPEDADVIQLRVFMMLLLVLNAGVVGLVLVISKWLQHRKVAVPE